MSDLAVNLTEWQTASPSVCPELRGVILPQDRHTAALLANLRSRGMLTVRQLNTGLEVEATSFIGSIQVGPVTVRVRPKVGPEHLWQLLGYAVGLSEQHVALFPAHDVPLQSRMFQDILAHALCIEAARLIA